MNWQGRTGALPRALATTVEADVGFRGNDVVLKLTAGARACTDNCLLAGPVSRPNALEDDAMGW